MDKHAPLITKTKTKKDHNPWFIKRFTKGSKPNKGWLRRGGSKSKKSWKTSWNISASIQYIKSTYIMPRKHIYTQIK